MQDRLSELLKPIADQNTIFESYCERDYSADCPPDWRSVESGYCLAGLSYSGSLDPYFVKPKTKEDKIHIENSYRLHWPCQKSCTQDFSLPCPTGWAVSAEGVCSSHTSSQTFNGFSATERDRRVFASEQNIPWPCQAKCQRDYHTFPCPLGWEQVVVENVNQCQAPEWYQGPCPGIQGLEGLTTDLLKQFEARCAVQYPCQACQDKDYSALCPLGYVEVEDQCQRQGATAGGTGGPNDSVEAESPTKTVGLLDSCPDTFTSSQTDEEKKALEDWCGARWPCAEPEQPSCAQDYNAPCPLGWSVQGAVLGEWSIGGDGTICISGGEYKGRCPSTLHVIQSRDFKKAFALHCNVNFPCLSDSAPELWVLPAAIPPGNEAGSIASQTDASGPIDRRGGVLNLRP